MGAGGPYGGWKSKSGADAASPAISCLSSLGVFMMLVVATHVNQMLLHLYRRKQESALRVQILGKFSLRAGLLTYLLWSDREARQAFDLALNVLPMIADVLRRRACPGRRRGWIVAPLVLMSPKMSSYEIRSRWRTSAAWRIHTILMSHFI